MSFFGGTDCAVNGNAVAQLNKHSQQDRLLQRQNLQPGPQVLQFKQEKMMNQRDMEHFMGLSPQAFQFQPMRHELNSISAGKSWSSEFRPDVRGREHDFKEDAHQEWAKEFPMGAQVGHAGHAGQMSQVGHAGQVGQMGQAGQVGQVGQMPMGMARMGMYRPMFQPQMPQVQQAPAQAQNQSTETEVDWDHQFKELEEQAQEEEPEIVIDDKYQATFQEVWDLLNQENDNDFISQQYEEYKNSQGDTIPPDLLQWEKDFARYALTRAHFGDYKFETAETNQFLNMPDTDPYQIGLQLMENGAKLSEAALAFEAAIARDANHVDAWLKLGEVQTQNEKEIAGITALERCLELNPENLEALMTLAISYINEGYDNAAFATLERWISTKYPLVAAMARAENPIIGDEDRFTLHKRVTELFIKAAQLLPDHANMDPDVQMGLGVLFYANEDFDKTIDCFKAALLIKPDDPVLWNRLGASLANSSRSEEAVNAYFKALELKPAFVRARYNLGVSCINIGCYKEAAEHLLSGLAMHQVEGHELTLSYNQSLLLMETLKRAFIAMDRRDLVELVKPGMDLDKFRGDFTF